MDQSGGIVWMGRIHKIGSSLGLIFPKPLREAYSVRHGDYFAVVVVDGLWVMRRIEKGMILDRDETATAIAHSVHLLRL